MATLLEMIVSLFHGNTILGYVKVNRMSIVSINYCFLNVTHKFSVKFLDFIIRVHRLLAR